MAIGLLALAGTLVTTYFSATPTLTCRPGSEYVECTLTATAIGLFEVDRQHVTGVRAVTLAPAVVPWRRGPPAPRLMFRDGSGDRPLGFFTVYFVEYAGALDAFARQPTPDGLLITPPLKARTILARVAALALAGVGLLVLISAFREMARARRA